MNQDIIDVDAFVPDIELVSSSGGKTSSEYVRRRAVPSISGTFYMESKPPRMAGEKRQLACSRDERQKKKQMKLALGSRSPGPSKRTRSASRSHISHEVIELLSDDEAITLVPKKSKSDSPEPTDSEEEYAATSAALDPHHAPNWKPEFQPQQAQDSLVERRFLASFDDLRITAEGRTPFQADRSHWGTGHGLQLSEALLADGNYTWNIIQKSHFLRRLGHQHSKPNKWEPEHLTADIRWQLANMQATASFRQAPGTINRIQQNGDLMAICTCVTGGTDDLENESPNPYNLSGSIMVYHDGTFHVGEGHRASRPLQGSETGGTFDKFYTINDIAFDPTNQKRLISSGSDCTIRTWEFEDPTEKERRKEIRTSSLNGDLLCYLEQVRNTGIESSDTTDDIYEHPSSALIPKSITKFDDPVLDLRYKPDASILAVACGDGKIYIYVNTEALHDDDYLCFEVAPRKVAHATGAMVWGLGPTSNLLFASSEPENDGPLGYHMAFDMVAQDVAYEFNVRDAGDAMAIDAQGRCLALFTNGTEHLLRIFDVREQRKDAVQEIRLEASLWPGFKWEVNTASYSPDCIYLVAARSDNISHVYDSRMLGNGPLHAFEHRGPRRDVPGHGLWGITDAQWIETKQRTRLGLVTGGIDGCIRLWDVTKSAEDPLNGTVVAQMDSAIACFHLGDIYKGEKALVVGDSNAISVFEKRSHAII